MVHTCRALGIEDLLDEDIVATVLQRRGVDVIDGNDNANIEHEEIAEEEEGVINEEGDNGMIRVLGVDEGGAEREGGSDNFREMDERFSSGSGANEENNMLEAEETSRINADIPDMPESTPNVMMSTSQSQLRRTRRVSVLKATKILILVAGGLFLLFLVSSWCMHAPIIAGRSIFLYFGVSIDNDLYCICVGFSVLVGAGISLEFMMKEISQSATALITLCFTWIWVVIKVLIIGVFVLGVAPLLLGFLVEAVVIIPLSVPLNESPAYPLLQGWGLGLLLLCFWARAVMAGIFGENCTWRTRLLTCARDGLLASDLLFILRDIVAPIFLFILDNLVFPFFVARTLGLCFTESYTVRTFIMRYSFLLNILRKLSFIGVKYLMEYIGQMHAELLDSRYLVGTELTNRP